MSIHLPDLLVRISRLNDSERAAVSGIIGRIELGRVRYGELCLKMDGRDFIAEASEELLDYLVYRILDRLKEP